MERIREACGREIAEATGGDPARSALLAAITANESGGSRQAYRFAPANHLRLQGLLKGAESKVDGLKRAQLEKALSIAHSESEKTTLLQKLAGLHGYTQLAGYFTILWKVPMESLTHKSRHFELAVQRLNQLCEEFQLDPGKNAAELGRYWNPYAPGRSAMYGWRLQVRMELYLSS